MAKDKIHDAIKNALIADGWTILADPYHLKYDANNSWLIDLAAEKLLLIERDKTRILVEVKTFGGTSFTKEFQNALGQYQLYAGVMHMLGQQTQLFLAISDTVYERFFANPVYQGLVEHYSILLLVVDVDKEQVVKWIN